MFKTNRVADFAQGIRKMFLDVDIFERFFLSAAKHLKHIRGTPAKVSGASPKTSPSNVSGGTRN